MSSGTVIRQSVGFLRGAGEISPLSGKNRGGDRKRAAVAVRPWSDEGHRLYYASPPRCGGVKDAKKKEEKRRSALVTELSRNLAALYSTGLGMNGEEGIAGEVRGNMIKEAAELLLIQLNEQKAKEKEMKKRKKEEKAAMKAAAKMHNRADESSSSSSESSDSDCEEVVQMNKPRKNLQEVKPDDGMDIPDQSTECNQELPSTEVIADEKAELNLATLKLDEECSSSNCMTSTAVASCGSSVVAVARPLNMIEVCMGGKCKKSGAVELLQEFEKKVGIEGAVVCGNCMGKCKQGPNVRVVNHCSSLQDELVEVSKKPLCIGVGLEDVSAIVANFLGEKDMDLGLLAA